MRRSDRGSYRSGSWYTKCDRSGFKVRGEEVMEDWTGLLVREEDWEPRHPQDFVRGRRDQQNPPFFRPEGDDRFLSPNQVCEDELDEDQSIRIDVTGAQRMTPEGNIRRTA